MVTRGTSYFKQSEYFEYMVIADLKSQKYYQLVPKTKTITKDFINHWHWREYSDVNVLISALQIQVNNIQISVISLDKLLPLPTDNTKIYAYKPETGWVEVTGGSGIVQSIVAGTGINVDSTDPANPIVSATGGGGTGDVVGPGSATNENISVFDGNTGKKIKDGGRSVASMPYSGDNTDSISDAYTIPFWNTVASIWRKITANNLYLYLKEKFDLVYSTFSGSFNDLTDIPTEFPPQAHGHNDTSIQLTESYSNNLSGCTTQKEANDVLDNFSSGSGHTIVNKSDASLTQRTKLKIFQETADDAGNDTTKVYPTFTKAGFLTEYDNGNSGASKTIDWNNGQNQKITLTADCTLTFTALSDINANTFRTQLKVIQDGTGGWNLFFPVGTVFCNGAFDFSTGTASQTCLVGIYYDGTKYYVIPSLYF